MTASLRPGTVKRPFDNSPATVGDYDAEGSCRLAPGRARDVRGGLGRQPVLADADRLPARARPGRRRDRRAVRHLRGHAHPRAARRGPLSDRFGRRACVLPFAALSPVATLLLILGPHDLALIAAGRALAGVCSGMVFGPATAWVQDLSGGSALSARRAALALSAGFGVGPIVAAALAQWARIRWSCPTCRIWCWASAALAAVWTVPDVRRAGNAGPRRAGRQAVGAASRAADPRVLAQRSRRPRRSCSARCRWRSSCSPRR